jgi:hypothetical protein
VFLFNWSVLSPVSAAPIVLLPTPIIILGLRSVRMEGGLYLIEFLVVILLFRNDVLQSVRA